MERSFNSPEVLRKLQKNIVIIIFQYAPIHWYPFLRENNDITGIVRDMIKTRPFRIYQDRSLWRQYSSDEMLASIVFHLIGDPREAKQSIRRLLYGKYTLHNRPIRIFPGLLDCKLFKKGHSLSYEGKSLKIVRSVKTQGGQYVKKVEFGTYDGTFIEEKIDLFYDILKANGIDIIRMVGYNPDILIFDWRFALRVADSTPISPRDIHLVLRIGTDLLMILKNTTSFSERAEGEVSWAIKFANRIDTRMKEAMQDPSCKDAIESSLRMQHGISRFVESLHPYLTTFRPIISIS